MRHFIYLHALLQPHGWRHQRLPLCISEFIKVYLYQNSKINEEYIVSP